MPGCLQIRCVPYTLQRYFSYVLCGFCALWCFLCFPLQTHAQIALENKLQRLAPTLKPAILQRALLAYRCARARKAIRKPLLAIIDYSLPSAQKRLWVFDLRRRSLLHHEWVAHGRGSGDLFARRFSNQPNSHQSSLGLYATQEIYYGKHGISLRLQGLERGFNHLARQRAIVIHGAWYVSRSFLQKHRRLGRSHGCPALRKKITPTLLRLLQGGAALYAYGNQTRWKQSPVCKKNL